MDSDCTPTSMPTIFIVALRLNMSSSLLVKFSTSVFGYIVQPISVLCAEKSTSARACVRVSVCECERMCGYGCDRVSNWVTVWVTVWVTECVCMHVCAFVNLCSWVRIARWWSKAVSAGILVTLEAPFTDLSWRCRWRSSSHSRTRTGKSSPLVKSTTLRHCAWATVMMRRQKQKNEMQMFCVSCRQYRIEFRQTIISTHTHTHTHTHAHALNTQETTPHPGQTVGCHSCVLDHVEVLAAHVF